MCGLLFSIFFAVCSDSALLHSNVHDYNKAESEAKFLAIEVLDAVGRSLQLRRPPCQLWARLTWMINILLQWFFPPHYKTFRTCANLEVLLACLFAARSLIWLRTRSWTQHAKSILNFFGPTLQAAIGKGGLKRSQDRLEALNYIIDLQKFSIEGFHGSGSLFGLYQWWTDSTRYTGIGQLDRPSFPHQGALSRRLFEHLFATFRPKSQDGKKLRYRLARRVHPSSSFFLIVAIGAESRIRALELFDIHAHCPRSNGVQKRQQVNTAKNRKLQRHRPPKAMRQKRKETDTRRSSAIMRRYESNFEAARAPKQVPNIFNIDFWSYKFRDAYTLAQQRMHVLTGNVGPLNIMEAHLRPLFMLYIANGKASFSWKQAEKQDPDVVLRCSLLLKKLQTSHQRGTARAVLDPWLRARGFCGTRCIRILISHRTLVDVATQRVRENAAKISKGNNLHHRCFTFL